MTQPHDKLRHDKMGHYLNNITKDRGIYTIPISDQIPSPKYPNMIQTDMTPNERNNKIIEIWKETFTDRQTIPLAIMGILSQAEHPLLTDQFQEFKQKIQDTGIDLDDLNDELEEIQNPR